MTSTYLSTLGNNSRPGYIARQKDGGRVSSLDEILQSKCYKPVWIQALTMSPLCLHQKTMKQVSNERLYLYLGVQKDDSRSVQTCFSCRFVLALQVRGEFEKEHQMYR